MTMATGDPKPTGHTDTQPTWLRTLRRYMTFLTAANIVWEFAHMPLYTLWDTGTYSEIVFAALHCSGGDALIGLSTIVLALFICGNAFWPTIGNRRVIVVTVLFGLCYTVFSEWLNIEVRSAWAYNDRMPVIPGIDMGLSPMLQWIIIPLAAFWWSAPQGFVLTKRIAEDA